MPRNCLRKSWEILRRTLEKSFENFLRKGLVFKKKILRMFLEKSLLFFEKLLKECFQKKVNSKTKSWNFEFWQFCKKDIEFFSNLLIFWVFEHSLKFKNAWDKLFNSWKDFWNFPEKFRIFEKKEENKENTILQKNVTNCLKKNLNQRHDRHYQSIMNGHISS